MKTKTNLTSILLAGAITLAGCSNAEHINPQKEYSSETTFITTAERVRIEPHYGSDSILIDGITVTKFAYGNGLDQPNIEESHNYIKGSLKYEALRPLLTVERLK